MIHVFCTKKATDMLTEKPKKYTGEIDPLDKWFVSLTTLQRKKVLVAMCADSCFGFVIWGIKKAQFAKLPQLIEEGIRKTFDFYGIRKEITDDYLSDMPGLCVGATIKELGQFNRLMADVSNTIVGQVKLDMIPMEFVSLINNRTVGLSKKETSHPIDTMLDGLKERYHKEPICRRAFQLTATMNLEVYKATRTLIVPEEYTFEQLHRVMQRAFDWKDYHMYEFDMGEDRIVCMADDYEEYENSPHVADTCLNSRLKEGDSFTYLYDFGDGWEVSIHVDSLMTDYAKPWPECTKAEGAAPPEDVGGVWGFVDFYEAYINPEHPDHPEMKEWVGYWSPKANDRSINYMLRKMY